MGTAIVIAPPLAHPGSSSATASSAGSRRAAANHGTTPSPIQPVRREISARPASNRRTSPRNLRSEEHTSELQSLMRNSYAVFCLKKTQLKHQHNICAQQPDTAKKQSTR